MHVHTSLTCKHLGILFYDTDFFALNFGKVKKNAKDFYYTRKPKPTTLSPPIAAKKKKSLKQTFPGIIGNNISKAQAQLIYQHSINGIFLTDF